MIPKSLKTNIFNMVEQNQTDELIQFIDKYQDHIGQFIAPNFWTLAMYAVRYGNHRLIRHLHERGLLLEHPQAQYTLLYIPCLNNDYDTFKLLVDEFGKDINQPVNTQQSDNSLLKYALKFSQVELIDILCSRGAYYFLEKQGNDVFANNLQREDDETGPKYKSYSTDKEVVASSVLSLNKNKLTAVHYHRYKNLLFVHYLLTVEKQKLHQDLSILKDNSVFQKVLEYLIPNLN